MAKPRQPAPAEANSSRPGWTARFFDNARQFAFWLRKNPVRGGITLLAACAVLGCVILSTMLSMRGPDKAARDRQLAEALKQLDAGNLRQARQLTSELSRCKTLTYQEHGGPLLIRGVITLHEAEEQTDPTKRRLLYLVASRYLEEARSRGWPSGRAAQGVTLLGKSLHAGGRYSESLPILREALQIDPQSAAQVHWMLTDSYLHLTPPRLDAALDHNRKFLALPSLTAHERHRGWLLQSRIQLDKGQLDAAWSAAGEIQEKASLHPDAVVMQGRVALAAWRQAKPLAAGEATTPAALIARLRALQTKHGLTPDSMAPIQLLIGMCYEATPDPRAAIAQYERIRRTHLARPEGLAATAFQAGLLVTSDPAEAVALYRRALAQAGPPEVYANSWLSLDEWSVNLDRAIERLIAGHHHAAALDLAQAMSPLLPLTGSLLEQSRVQRAWAEHLLERSRGERPELADVTRAEARQHWREAGVAGRKLAEVRIATRYYLDDLAQAATDFLRGQGYKQAAETYRDLLKQDPRQGQPEALVGLGEAQLALGQADEALAELKRCIDGYPKHPATYRARWLASLALQEKGQLSDAAELLVDNLYRHSLAPQSSDWRDSLFAYGFLKHRQGLEHETNSRIAGIDRADPESRREGLKHLEQSHVAFQEAVRALKEAVQRYPTAPAADEARYCVAEAYRHRAKWPRKRLGTVTIETTRVALNRQIQEELLGALEQYTELITRLSDGLQSEQGAIDAALLRNCYFGRADALFDLGRFEDAAQAYSAATNRYQHEPESLEAYVQIASCYRRLNRLPEARGTLEQARVVLLRIRPDADFTRTTRYSRDEWTQLLAWLRTL